MRKEKAIEVGNIFPLKTKFSDTFKLTYKDETGKDQPVIMGCYGIGLGRVMGAVVEVHHDANGICWPAAIAPYAIHLVRLGDEPETIKQADILNKELTTLGVETLYDERAVSAGVKLKDSDLIGLPVRLVVSSKTASLGKFEYKKRTQKQTSLSADVKIIKTLL